MLGTIFLASKYAFKQTLVKLARDRKHDRWDPPNGGLVEGKSPKISGKSIGWWNMIPFGQESNEETLIFGIMKWDPSGFGGWF